MATEGSLRKNLTPILDDRSRKKALKQSKSDDLFSEGNLFSYEEMENEKGMDKNSVMENANDVEDRLDILRPWTPNYVRGSHDLSAVVARRGKRGKFAWIVVELDLSKSLIPKFFINGKRQSIEYEGLPRVCFSCGVCGHVKEECHKHRENLTKSIQGDQRVENQQQKDFPFGLWMLVTRRKPRGEDAVKTGCKGQTSVKVARRDQVVGSLPKNQRFPHKQVGAASGDKSTEMAYGNIEDKLVLDKKSNARSEDKLKDKGKEVCVIEDEKFIPIPSQTSQSEEVTVKERSLDPMKHTAIIIANKSISCNSTGKSSTQMRDHVTMAEKLGGKSIHKRDDKPPDKRGSFHMQKVSLKKKTKSKNSISSSRSNALPIVRRGRANGADKVIGSLNFDRSYRVDASGFSGGIWVLWKDWVQLLVERLTNLG
ncbi:Uncharacterized protein TCM_036266 [Theobroma cacao]|uniref:CCHC-type domain-containing protein n=1 Tax=Theobroma cacao TaxID=3641 RepID=A0A061FRD1_THECC|nr:Uncharacterized protein TCM_036266 [Theobroma cacao]